VRSAIEMDKYNTIQYLDDLFSVDQDSSPNSPPTVISSQDSSVDMGILEEVSSSSSSSVIFFFYVVMMSKFLKVLLTEKTPEI